MPAKTKPRGRADFRRAVAKTKLVAARSGLFSAALHQAADACANPDVQMMLRDLADNGREHRGQVEDRGEGQEGRHATA